MTTSQHPAMMRVFSAFAAFVAAGVSGNAQTEREKEDAAKEEKAIVLSPFQVSTDQDKGYQTANTLSGIGIDTPISKLPQTIQVANQQLIQDLGLGTGDLISALEVASSSVVRRSYNNGDDQFVFGFRLPNTIRDGVPVGTANPLGVMYDIDRIEVIKGPAAALFGQASFIGGIINYVPRKPSRTPKYMIQATGGSYDAKSAVVHAAGPITPTFRYRLDLGMSDNGGRRLFSFSKDKFVGAGFEYDVSSNALLSLELGRAWQHRTQTWTIMDLRSTAKYATVDPRLGDELSVNSKFDDYASARTTAGAKLLLNLPKDFSSMTSVAYNQVRFDINRVQVSSISADLNKLSRLGLRPFAINEHNTFVVQSFFKKFQTGPITHKAGLSGDARFQTSVTATKFQMDPGPFQDPWTTSSWSTPSFNLNAPVYPDEQRVQFVAANSGVKVNNRVTGATLYDVASMWNDRLTFMYNYRYSDQFQTSGNAVKAYQSTTADPFQTVAAGSVITRRYAATVEPIKDVLLYYNQGQAFIFNPGLDWLNNPLVPSIGEVKQFGANVALLGGALTLSVAHFDIAVTHVRIVFIQGPSDPVPGSSSIAQGGTQTNKGYDFSANFSKKFEAGQVEAIVTAYAGKLRDETGNKVQHTVNNTTSLWASFAPSQAPLKGFKVGAGANYTGERVGPITVTQAVGGAHPTRIEPYWKSRAMIAYNYKRYGIQLNVDNLADKRAITSWESSLWMYTDPGRVWRLTASYRF